MGQKYRQKQADKAKVKLNGGSDLTKSQPRVSAKSAELRVDQIRLRQEILALGGTEEDFKLLEGVDSDGEDAAAGEKPAVKATDAAVPANEIADFLKSIGLSAESAQEFAFNAEEEGDDEEEEEDDDVEDDSEYADDDDLEQDEEDDQQAPQLVSAHSASLARMLLPPNPRWYATELPSVDSILPQAPATIVTQAHTQAQVNKNRRGGKKKKQQQQQRLEQGGPATANATLVITPLHIKAVADVVREYTQSLLSDEHLSYDAHRARVASSDHQWFKTVIKSGTLTDRVGALSLAVRESPAHNLPYLEQLVSMCQKKNRREAMIAVDTVKDLVVGSSGTGLVPGDRKLRFFAEQPDFLQRIVPAMASDARIEAHVWLQHPAVKQHLVLWAVEDAVKTRYYELIVSLDQLSHDPVHHVKSKVLSHAWELLTEKKEQERTLLTFLVNKLGDLDRKIASKTGYLLQQLLLKHPLMKMVVVKEVEVLMYRKGVDARTQYYASVFLNQVMLSKRSADVLAARYLIHLYFKLFERIVNANDDGHGKQANGGKDDEDKKGYRKAEVLAENGVEAKMMAALMTGINRAFPYASHRIPEDDAARTAANTSSVQLLLGAEGMDALYEKHIDTFFKMTHLESLSFTTSVQALQLVYQILWRPADEKATGNDSAVTNNQAVFSPKLASRYYRALYALLMDPRLIQSSKHFAVFFNLLFKSLKSDPMPERLVAVARRLLQICATAFGQTPALCASLVVLGEVLKLKRKEAEADGAVDGPWAAMDRLIKQNTEAMTAKFVGGGNADSDDEEEHFVDVDSESEEPKDDTDEKVQASAQVASAYDPLNRSPEYAKATAASLWELVALSRHFHPTVALFAKTLLYHGAADETQTTSTNDINYPSDPLQDFTLIRFLDRFVYKNPKATAKDERGQRKAVKSRGNSIMQPRAFQSSVLRQATALDREYDAPVNSAQWKHREHRAPADEQFFVPYFARTETTPKAVAVKDGDEDDDEDVDDDEEAASDLDDAEVMDAIMKSVPGSKDELIPGASDDEIESDDAYEADFAAMMESDGEQDEDDQNEEDEEWSEVDDDGNDEDALAFGASDSDADDDDMPKAAKRRQQKDAIRNRLTGEGGQPAPRFNVNAALDAASDDDNVSDDDNAASAKGSKKEKSGSSAVFASVDDFAHLLQLDPDHNDESWQRNPEAEMPGEIWMGQKRGRGGRSYRGQGAHGHGMGKRQRVGK